MLWPSLITGQVSSAFIGTDAFQEIDVLGLSLACTKHSFLVESLEDLPSVMAEAFAAFAIAQSGHPGPVLVDIPKDIQIASGELTPHLLPVEEAISHSSQHIAEARELMAQAHAVHRRGC